MFDGCAKVLSRKGEDVSRCDSFEAAELIRAGKAKIINEYEAASKTTIVSKSTNKYRRVNYD